MDFMYSKEISAVKAQEVRDDMRRMELSVISDFPEVPREITCENCQDNDNCEYAFDWYNTDGDCLAIK